MTVRPTLRIVSAMIAFSFFVLFFGVLVATGARGYARHGDFDKGRKAFMDLVFTTESVIMATVLLVMLIPLYVYAIIEGSVNTIVKKLKLLIQFPRGHINRQIRNNVEENTQNKEEQEEETQLDEGFLKNVWERFNALVAAIGLQFETINQEIDAERAKLNNADLKKESGEKGTNELSLDTDQSAPVPRIRRKKKKRRSKWR